MREEVEGLENHANVSAEFGESLAFFWECGAVECDASGVNGFESVDGATQGGFP